jgi:integrase
MNTISLGVLSGGFGFRAGTTQWTGPGSPGSDEGAGAGVDGANRAGVEVPVSPQWLRHAYASHALDRGAPVHLVQATSGHASVATTGKYLHTRPED